MAEALTELAARGDFLDGRFVRLPESAQLGLLERVSPRDFSDVVARHPFRLEAVDEAVAAARRAFRSWTRLSDRERRNHLWALKQALLARADELARMITREVGKPLWEARTEVSAALNKIDITLSDGAALVQPCEMGGPAQRYAFRPHGVAAVLGPFNFPLHLLHGHVVPALLTGNTVVVKPSELAASVGQLYAECFEAAALPAGVFNLVQGDGRVGARLAAHPDVDVVMLTGSYEVGQSIKRATLEQPHKLLALELGGHNPAIVLQDANLDKAVHDVLWGAFITTGQRCSGTAVAMVERSRLPEFQARLLAKVAKIRVGDPFEQVFMGPLVSEAARARYLGQLAQAERDGALVLHATRSSELELSSAYVAPSVHLLEERRGIAYETTELFGPDLALLPVCDLDEAISLANQSPYGLSASVFTSDRGAFEYALSELRYGCVNLNVPTCGASSKLPFGGTRKSGNHRPAALFSTLYCTYPVSTLEGAEAIDVSALSPGLVW